MRQRLQFAGRLLCGLLAVPVCILATALTSRAALADDPPNVLADPFQISLGTFIVNTDTKVRLNGKSEIGDKIDWENTFGSGDVTRFRIDGHWRFADRHKVRFLWFNNSRSTSKTLEQEIDWGGEIYPVNAKVKSEFNFDVYELAYEYAFLRRDSYELAGTIGLHYTDLSLALAAKASASGGTLERDVRKEGSVAAPLPVIGLHGLWQLPHHFWIDAQAQFFALSIDEYDGSLIDYKVMATWQPKKWLGIGLGYNQFAIDVDIKKESFRGSLDWTYKGPMLQYSAVF
jgi:hypothetical protein